MPFEPFDIPSPDNEDARLLRQARSMLACPNRWAKRDYGRWPQVCASHAIHNVVNRGSPSSNSLERRLRRMLIRELPLRYQMVGRLSTHAAIVAFNDSRKVDHAMVVHAFDRAISRRELQPV